MRRATVVLAGVGLAAAGVVGCGGSDEPPRTIGNGPVTLVFDNDGSDTIDVDVSWTGHEGQERHREFDLGITREVEVRLADTSEYRIELKARCGSATTPAPLAPTHEVIVAGEEP